MIIKGHEVIIEFFVLVFAFEFEAVLRLYGVRSGRGAFEIQITKCKV